MGQLLGYVAGDQAAIVGPAVQRTCGGVHEAKGLIVGGWDDGYSEGKYGVRVWITTSDAHRFGVVPGDIDPSLRPRRPPWPVEPPPAPGERRLSPTPADLAAGRFADALTVICEEHYQPAIVAVMPPGWEPDRSWPVLAELAVADCNPHSKHTTPCVEVRISGQRVGFLTPTMTERHQAAIVAAGADGSRVTATATASRGTKAGSELWRLKVHMAQGGSLATY